MRSDHCWSHGRGRPSASFQAGSCTARARASLRQRDGEHLEQDAIDVVLGLLLGEAERVHLHAVAEAAMLGVARRRSGLAVISSHSSVKARILQISVMNRRPALTKKEMRPTTAPKSSAGDFARRLARRRARLARWRARRPAPAPASRPLPAGGRSRRWSGSTSAWPRQVKTMVSLISRSDGCGREHVGAARQVLLDDVVLDGAGELGRGRALRVGGGDVEREQPRRRGVDRHGGVHLAERDAVEQRAHVAQVRDRARRPCRPRRAPARDRRRSRSASADRRRWRGRSALWPGSCGRARWTWRPSNGPSRCGTARACRVPAMSDAADSPRRPASWRCSSIRNREMPSL